MPISEVHNCDCMDFMRTLPDDFFDLAVADPPFGISYARGKNGWGVCDNRPALQDVKWDIAVTIVNTLPVSTSCYYRDSEDGSTDTSDVNWEDEYKSQYLGIPALLNELAKYIDGELASGVSGSRRWELRQMLEECRGWKVEDIDISES